MVISVLEDMGYQPRVDSDGDVLFRFQMKHLYVLATQQEETPSSWSCCRSFTR